MTKFWTFEAATQELELIANSVSDFIDTMCEPKMITCHELQCGHLS